MPDVLTLSEAGVPGFAFNTWAGIYAPHGTPKPVIERLNAEVIKASGDSSVRERLLGLGMEAGSSTPEQLGTMTREGLVKMTKLIKGLGIKAE